MKEWKKIMCILLCGLLMCGFAACAEEPGEASAASAEEASIQINPLPEAVSKDKETARLYFGYMQEPLLIGEVRVFSVPINENIQTSIITELIKGPSAARADFTQIINPETKVVSVRSEGTNLFVTLSKEFLSPPEETLADSQENETYEETRKMLAVYSIVNTLIEQGTYSRVQIYIDDDGTGNGRPLTLAEAGLGADGTTEALERNGALNLSGPNTLREIMSCIENKSWDTLYNYISYKNLYGEDKPSLEEFRSEVTAAKLVISDFKIGDEIEGADGLAEVVMASYVLKLRDGDAQTVANVPIKLIMENDIWKMTYTEFKRNFLS